MANLCHEFKCVLYTLIYISIETLPITPVSNSPLSCLLVVLAALCNAKEIGSTLD